MARTDICPECKHVEPLSQVQIRRIWESDFTLKCIAFRVSQIIGADPAFAEEAAHEHATRFIRRYSALNKKRDGSKITAKSYLAEFIKVSLRRWANDDAPGGKSVREQKLETLDTSAAANPERIDEIIDASDLLGRIRKWMTAGEMALIEQYATGAIPWSPKVEKVLSAARAAVYRQPAGNKE